MVCIGINKRKEIQRNLEKISAFRTDDRNLCLNIMLRHGESICGPCSLNFLISGKVIQYVFGVESKNKIKRKRFVYVGSVFSVA